MNASRLTTTRKRGAIALALGVASVAGAFVVAAPSVTADPLADVRLANAIDAYSTSLGLPQTSLAKVTAAHLPSGVANALAGEVEQLYACDVITKTNIPAILQTFKIGLADNQVPVFPGTQTSGETILGVPVSDFPDPTLPEQFPFETAVRACGDAVVNKLDTVRNQVVAANLPRTSSIDAWPVLRFAPGNVNDTYTNDYVLLVDGGGANKFLNNAGGNALDIWRGPAGSVAKTIAPARGCIDALDLIRAQTCSFDAAAALVIGDGNQFEQLEAPDVNTDANCTNDPVVKRLFTQGMGLAGVGVLRVEGSHNAFYGKTMNNGFGHLGGYGYQRTDGNDNHYTTIRSAYGSAILGGIGTFVANGNDNVYSTYLPGPKDPNAAPGMPGSGGVASDVNNCDSGQAITLGAGSIGGVGLFTAAGVGNSYNAPIQSLGYGRVLGLGRFHQSGGGTDSYTGPGAVGRGNDVTVEPTTNINGEFIDN